MTDSAPDPEEQHWDRVIVPRRKFLDIPFAELWRYRDLIVLLAKRDFSAQYKQTVLGPLWFIIQPLLTTFAFSFLFGRMAGLGTEHIPHFLFYMAGLAPYTYFSDCINKSAFTFTRNAALFGKVYFPRLAVPLAQAITNLIGFGFYFGLFLIGLVFYLLKARYFPDVHHPFFITPNWRVIFLPIFLLQIAMFGLGAGLIISSLTTKYRDLSLAVGFGVQLWMYGSSVVYPLQRVADPTLRSLMALNPMVPTIEAFRFAFLGEGLVTKWQFATSFGLSATLFLFGLMMFTRTEQTVMDTV